MHLTEPQGKIIVVSKEVFVRPKRVACNNGASGYTAINVIEPAHLTEPQGKIKKLKYATLKQH